MNGSGSSSHALVSIIKLAGSVQGALLRVGETYILLNCGDPSPSAPTAITSMTTIGLPQGSIVSAVLVTDWRISSSGMLPHFLSVYNTHHNRRNKDKTSKTKGGDGNASFLNDSAIASISSLAFDQPCVYTDPRGTLLTITAHRAGHVAGGCLYTIEVDGTQVAFVDGFNLHGSRVLLPASLPPRPPHIALIRGNYSVTVSETRTVIEREFCKVIHDVINLRGKVVIPVFGVGCFFHDILSMLTDYWVRMELTHVPIYVTSDTLLHQQATPFYHALLLDSYTNAFNHRTRLPVYKLPSLQTLEEPNTPMVVFSEGASLTSGDTASALQAIGQHVNNLLVLSEFCTKGTINRAFLNNEVCAELSKSFHASITCRVHELPSGEEGDARDVAELTRQLRPRHHVVLAGVDDGHVACFHEAIPSDGRLAPFSVLGDDDLVLSVPRDIGVRVRSNVAFNRGPMTTLLVAEPRKKMAVYGESSLRRLKKKRHALEYDHSWKYPKSSAISKRPKEVKKRSGGASFMLQDLLVNDAPDSDDPEEEMQANVSDVHDGIYRALHQWMGVGKYPIERRPMSVEVGSVQVDVSTDWSINMRWSFDDEELASRVFGLAQRVVQQQYGEAHNHSYHH
ncbi:hypothetical protein SPRG_10457 [Saprolegnia parasitica CBS 223.65]|uniref:Beta-Casp domain-containing protein n=1 Tax=Saprolegnia parasitica (strain CBS 223.65) TaxID=695850 RepID=A0A067C0R4_SAPPC|nr:hypothetical protein SPRG_10457 [Saprolegnia parasitica CBS 223.65]KDO24379.1 hypothetical protein SPRG_10457 [Saprolegnia parasitica CBS 223.65]|eukprot:XP_012204972.1 hypothetical protein SPRG_10457 [Saprolegnia parasitica CBS 223.65]